MTRGLLIFFFFFFNDTATTEIYTLSLHDALPIFDSRRSTAVEIEPLVSRTFFPMMFTGCGPLCRSTSNTAKDRKSTRLNSSHGYISYAVFCLKKKKTDKKINSHQILVDH